VDTCEKKLLEFALSLCKESDLFARFGAEIGLYLEEYIMLKNTMRGLPPSQIEALSLLGQNRQNKSHLLAMYHQDFGAENISESMVMSRELSKMSPGDVLTCEKSGDRKVYFIESGTERKRILSV